MNTVSKIIAGIYMISKNSLSIVGAASVQTLVDDLAKRPLVTAGYQRIEIPISPCQPSVVFKLFGSDLMPTHGSTHKVFGFPIDQQFCNITNADAATSNRLR